MTGDPYKGTYIEPLSQRPPSNSPFLKAVLKYVHATYNVHAYSRLIYTKGFFYGIMGYFLINIRKEEREGAGREEGGKGFDHTEVTHV